MDPSTSKTDEKLTETQLELQNFFPNVLEEIKKIKVIEPGNQLLPLARIKKIMKLDEDVKMISAEAPLLFAKATEIFIHELTLRAWLHTEDNKRRTLQRNDIAMAISKYDQFDFLIDIVPRDEIKPKKETENKPTVQEVFYVQAPGQTTMQTIAVPATTVQTQSAPQTIQLQNGMQTSPAQNIILQSPTQQQQQQQQTSLIQLGNPTQQIQLVQQVVGPNGEISQIPVQMTQQQLSMLRSQMAGTSLIVAPQTQIFQTQTGQNIAIPLANLGQQGIYINPQTGAQIQTTQQQPQQQMKEEQH
jgi:nuclear transcription factor Y, gamma